MKPQSQTIKRTQKILQRLHFIQIPPTAKITHKNTNPKIAQIVKITLAFLALGFVFFAQANPLQCQLPKTASYTLPQKHQQAIALIVQSMQNFDNATIQKIAELDYVLGRLYLLQLDSVLNQNNLQWDFANARKAIKCKSCYEFAKKKFSILFGGDSKKESSQAQEPTTQDIKEFLALDLSAKVGEELLCVGLAKKDSKILIESYAHFALAGINTRAVNALLGAIKMGDKDAAVILEFLLDNGIYVRQNKIASQMVKIAISSGNLDSIFANPNISNNFFVREFDAHSNLLENLLYQKLIARGEILSEQDSRYEDLSQQEKENIAQSIKSELEKLKSIKQAVIAKMSPNEKTRFNDALKFKQHLHNVDENPYAKVFVVK